MTQEHPKELRSQESALPESQIGEGRRVAPEGALALERRLLQLKRRLVREARLAVEMLESALRAFLTLDEEAAAQVRKRDDRIDGEEVQIEQQCYEVLTLFHPFARDFRVIAFILKVNQDIERIADHAVSVAKMVKQVRKSIGPGAPIPRWPTALVELSQRVPLACHELMRAVLDEDPEAARQLVAGDEVIDQLDRRLFDEIHEMARRDASMIGCSIAIYRVGRELERVGDLMSNVAEDVVYLATGAIIRHGKRRQA